MAKVAGLPKSRCLFKVSLLLSHFGSPQSVQRDASPKGKKEKAMQKYLIRSMDFLKDGDGATAAEYGLLLGLIALAIVAGVSAFGTNLGTYYTNIVASLPF
jgi:Flp pilus assembly pilin Flp